MTKNKINIYAIIFVVISLLTMANSLLYYELDVNYNRGEIKIESAEIYFSHDKIDNLYNEDIFNSYSLELTDYKNEVITRESFSVPNKVWYDNADKNGQIVSGGYYILNETNFFLYIPYNEESKEIILKNKEKILDTKTISEFSKKGYDNKDYINNSENNNPRDNNTSIKNQSNNGLNYILIALLILIIIIIVIIIFNIKKKK